jgi:hypothetical protein
MERFAYVAGAGKRRFATLDCRSSRRFPGQPRRDIPAMRHSINSGDRCKGYRQMREYCRVSNQCLHARQEDNTAVHRIAPPLDTWFPGNGYVSQMAVRHVDGCGATKIPVVYAQFRPFKQAQSVYK